MKSNYKPIGNYIRLVDERNKGLKFTNLLGVSISKQFIPSVANIIGTDMENYKIIRKNQFACSTMQVRRDKKMPVALYQEEQPSIISQAYPIFEVIDTKELLPEYLMMWFTRSEFDREACFNAVGGVRGSLEWEDFCNMQIPIPTIEKQQEIVKEYHILVDRIELNNQLITKLEETAQAIYKQWFVDFEFPDEKGLPYKSNGGEMVESDLGEIPLRWEYKSIFEISNVQYGFPFNSEMFCQDKLFKPLIRIRDILSNSPETFTNENVDEKYLIKDGDILIGMDGIFHICLWFGGRAYQNQRIVRLRNDKLKNISSLQLYYSVLKPIKDLEGFIQGTTVAHLSDKNMKELGVLIADNLVQEKANKVLENIAKSKVLKSKENLMIEKILNVLHTKMSKIEN
jgi:type I restriction enzyme S subunit